MNSKCAFAQIYGKLSNLNTLAREVERCGCNEGNSSQGDAFNVFVLFVN